MAAVEIQALETADLSSRLVRLIADHDSLQWAVAWATENDVVPALMKSSKKIDRLVIGTHFCQTSPTLLAKLAACPGVRVMPSTGGTFHPKLYLFTDADRGKWTAVVGSPNFTNGAFTANAEIALLVTGADQKDPIFESLQDAMIRYWKTALPIDEQFLRKYRIQHRALASVRRALAKPPDVRPPRKDARHPGLLDYSFEEFAVLVERETFFRERIALLKGARELFARKPEFSDMDGAERRAIAGLIDAAPEVSADVKDWKLFGSMRGMGDFANRVGDNDPHLSRALDAIPPAGEVSEADYRKFIEEFLTAFKNSARIGGVPTASRLLTMKRPDRFVCVDSKNGRDLAADLGYSYSTLTFDGYWQHVALAVTQSAWWQSDRPKGPRKAIWDGRVALLDALYYRSS
jgi:HKD family nuclease